MIQIIEVRIIYIQREQSERLRAVESVRSATVTILSGPHTSGRKRTRRFVVMSVNKVIVIGNLGANPNIRALPSGQNVANFSLATTERFTDRNGAKQERTDWHRIVAFGRLGGGGGGVLHKGRLPPRQYEAKDGSGKRYRTEIVARQLRLLGNRTNANASKAEASDDIP